MGIQKKYLILRNGVSMLVTVADVVTNIPNSEAHITIPLAIVRDEPITTMTFF